MEILIPGLILVALMVYVSTRIKRTAADAYEQERVETDDFAVSKPEGFIIIVNDDPNVLFAAYSKEYGTEEADVFRQVAAEVRIHKDLPLEEVRDSILAAASKTIDERHLAGGPLIVETETTRDGITFDNESRLWGKGAATFEFRLTALSETRELNRKNIDEMLSSFEVK
jgi:hypothetical protein